MAEGTTVVPKYNNLLAMAADQYYKNKPFVYISNRVNSYSVDPSIHIEMSKIQNLVGFAVISNDPLQKKQTQLEQSLFAKELRLFDTIKEAIEWKNEIIQKYFQQH
ncbi:hypothetical protein GCM10022258_16200 [Aquimarina gracilis]